MYRQAYNSDKKHVLDFCKRTFEWGDYIDRVWDMWINEEDSLLLVAVEGLNVKKGGQEKTVAMAHAKICKNNMIWIEGIRVDPKYRRNGIATALMERSLKYGREEKVSKASTIVSIKNNASNRLMKKFEFEVSSTWIYISTKDIYKVRIASDKIKIANISEYESIISYLKKSAIFKSSAQRYVSSWRWYMLTENNLVNMIHNNQILYSIEENGIIRGIAIIDKNGYWNNKKIFQIIYLDADSDQVVSNFVEYCLSLVNSANKRYYYENGLVEQKNEKNGFKKYRYERVQLFFPVPEYTLSILDGKKLKIDFFEKFLIYDKKINT